MSDSVMPTDAVPAALEQAASVPLKPRMRGWIHTWAVGVSAIAVVVLVAVAARVSATAGWSTLVYGLTVCGVFGVSATYHRVTWPSVRARTHMKRADHSMIFLFIAGTYTPFALLGLPRHTGTTLLIVVWAGALAGVALKLLWPRAPRWVGVPLYLVLGWAIVPVAAAMTHNVGVAPMVLLLIGGLAYSGGAILYATKWPNPWPAVFGHHEFFHAATVLAALCHYLAVWLVVVR
ncbi:hemolysin III family protein [Nocardia sp. NEAU-G5]|uniref:Hemolysin III family protein n=1 Tax=Nocardia albiluteola TaxID=2842303 RepID=A0ABS6AYD5_9NOCA|nr:hemolysin III family protein [Nocardia albiluteola]MBU3063062.1 hemolysin III family protein [Nocardia albiluteola]